MIVSETLEKALTESEERMATAMDRYADILEAAEDSAKQARINLMISHIVSYFDLMTTEIINCGEAIKNWDNPNR